MDAKTLLEELNERPGMPVTFHHGSYAYQTMLSAIKLAAAVEGPEEATPETDAYISAAPLSFYDGLLDARFIRTLERRMLTALRALKAERERADTAWHVVKRASQIMSGDGVNDQGEAWDQTVRLLDSALAAQEGRHD